MTEDGGIERRRVAVHEAGHVVVMYFRHVPFRSATIVGDDDAAGRAVVSEAGDLALTRSLEAAEGSRQLSLRDRERLEARAMASLGGGAAELRYVGGEADEQWYDNVSYDREAALGMLEGLSGSSRQLETYYAWIDACTQDVIEARWAVVEAVADALESRGTLGRAGLLKSIRLALYGPQLTAQMFRGAGGG